MPPSPPTSAGSTTPRRIFACERCFRRKQRCDRALPVCTPCRTSRSACTESDREVGAVQIDDNTITRKGYVTTLVERLDALEDEARRRGLTVGDTMGDNVAGDDSQHGESYRPVSQPSTTVQVDPEMQSVAGPKVDMEMLSLSAMAEPRSRAEEFLKQLSMPRIIAGVTQTYGGNPEITSRVDSLWEGISQYIRHPAAQSRRLHVSHDEAIKSLETYLDVVDFRFPRLPVSKVRSGIEAITAPDESVYQERLSNDPAHIFMAYMIIAIVPLVSDNYPISQGSFVSIHLLAKCLKVLDRVFNQEDGVDIIQCLHLLVLFSIHCSAAGSAWHLIGFAMNKCIGLGYHREDDRHVPGRSDEEAQQRRWAFWGCYFLDRLICNALGRPFTIQNRDIGISLPDEVSNIVSSPSPSPIEACHIHLFRYAILLSHATSNQSQEDFHSHLGHLLQWRASTPPSNDVLIERARLYQTSLFHTLMLRLAISQIVHPYRFEDPGDSFSSLSYTDPSSGQSRRPMDVGSIEHSRVTDLSLLDICRAVSISIDRPGMAGRHFLSMITGYSAFSMALAVLYHRATVLASCAVPEPSGQGSIENYWHDLLRVACEKLTITGRQFPRMQEYKRITDRLWTLIDKHAVNHQSQADVCAEIELLKLDVMTIGPSYLKRLAGAILFLIAR